MKARKVLFSDVLAAEHRFKDKYTRLGPDDCWPWTASKSRAGYGKFTLKSHSSFESHRIAYVLEYGEYEPYDDDGKRIVVDHECRNPNCVNPRHLRLMTHAGNTMIGEGACAQNARKTSCNKGHEYTEENTIIRKGGHRRCKKCAQASTKKYQLRIKREKREKMDHGKEDS